MNDSSFFSNTNNAFYLNYKTGDNGITDFATLCPDDINNIIVQSGDNDITDFAICQVLSELSSFAPTGQTPRSLRYPMALSLGTPQPLITASCDGPETRTLISTFIIYW